MPTWNKTFVDELAAPPSGYKIYWHDTIKGLGLRMTATVEKDDPAKPGAKIKTGGKKTFVAQGRIRGVPVCVTIGPSGTYTVKTAEDTARQYLQDMRKGIDPREVRKRAEKSKAPTLRQLADAYMARPGKLKESSKSQIERHVVTTFKDKEHRPITEIDERYVRERYDHMIKGGLHGDREGGSPGQAIQSHAILKAMMNYAIRNKRGITANPCETAVNVDNRARLNERESYIQQSKVGAVWNMLTEQRAQAYTQLDMGGLDLALFLLLTGTRLSEAATLTWDRVNLDEEEPWFHLPDPKNRQPFWIPLSTQALAMLKVRRREVPQAVQWVFPSDRAKSGHIEEPRSLWPAISKLAGEPISAHDLRRTYTTFGIAECKIDLYKVELLTGHKPSGVVLRHYAKTMTQKLHWLRPETQMVADFIERKALIAAGKNVVELPARKAG